MIDLVTLLADLRANDWDADAPASDRITLYHRGPPRTKMMTLHRNGERTDVRGLIPREIHELLSAHTNGQNAEPDKPFTTPRPC